MITKIIEPIDNGVLTEPMEGNSKEFNDFKLLIKSKVENANKDDRINLALLALKFKMEDSYNSMNESMEVGSFLKQFIQTIEIKQSRFAEYVNMKPSNLSKLLNGDRRINIEFSLILEKLSGIEAELWLNIQSKYELEKTTKKMRNELSNYKLKQLIE